MRALSKWCGYTSLVSWLAAGTATAQGPAAPPTELPVVIEVDGVAAAPPAGGAAPGAAAPGAAPAAAAPAGTPAAAADGACEPCKDWTAKVPVVTKFPPLGLTIIQPTGPGYYSLEDWWRGNCRQAPPKYPYPRQSLMAWSFFDADWKYLDDPKNTECDFWDPLKRMRIGDNFLFSTGGELRSRYNDEQNSRLSGRDNNYDLYRTRIYGDLWYRDVARLFVEGIYAESYRQDLPRQAVDVNRGDLLNAFVDLKVWETCKDHPIYFRIGRQELLYGSERLISPLEWVNTRRTFQGAKLFYRGEKWDADMFVVQPVVPNANNFDSVDNNQVFSGAWVTYRPEKGVAIDAYYLNLDNTNPTTVGRGGVLGGQNVSTIGSRYYSNAKPVMWDLEGMVQFGEAVNQHILAKAFTTGVGYQWKDLAWSPAIWGYYDYASGDPNPGAGGTRRTFNQLFPFGHYYFGYIDQVGRRNINDFNAQLSFFPARWITCLAQYHVFRLDSDRDALYNAAGAAVRRDPTGAAGNDVGNQIDLLTNIHLSAHSDLLFGYSHLNPGDFLRLTGSGRSPDFFYAQMSYRW